MNLDKDEFPPNNRRARPAREPVEKKVVEKVVSGQVIRRKPSLGKRFKEMFMRGDSRTVGAYVVWEIFVPALKDTIADMVSQGAERMLFGEGRSTSRRTGSRPTGPSGYTAYNRYSAVPPWRQERKEEPRPSRHGRPVHGFDDIVLKTRAEAEEVLWRMKEYIEKYEQATVMDLMELVGEHSDFTDEKYGWTSTVGFGITRIRDGYLLDFPRPEQLD